VLRKATLSLARGNNVMADRSERADVFLVSHGFAASRAEAQAAIRAGRVEADGKTIHKAAQRLSESMSIHYQPAHPFVSRGGVKLAAALDRFQFSPQGRVCLDVGASTGGFTQVLLERGAMRVYAVDVGHGQLHAKIAGDPRVVSREGVNARELSEALIPERVGAIVADVSFISLKLVLAPVFALAARDAWAVLLVKPQFELGRWGAPRSGVVKSDEAREQALSEIIAAVKALGWHVAGSMESPIAGGEGNREYLLAATKGDGLNR
jgi:23S rRNA (cytidine1920-2'-O)/16S rRNA (cytidine1409-2'-O)-methyltransferase